MHSTPVSRVQYRWLSRLGLVLLAAWVGFWAESVRQNHLAVENSFWFPPVFRLGIDFDINYYGARGWREGGNPYQAYATDLWVNQYDHPPFVMVLASVSNILPKLEAYRTWLLIQTAIAVLAAGACYHHRQRLGMTAIPFSLILAAIAWCHPLMFEMERGNWNTLVLILLMAATFLLKRSGASADVLAGVLIAAAAWIKMYPGLAFFALLVMRRWRAAGACAIAAAVIGLASLPYLMDFKNSLTNSSHAKPDSFGFCPYWTHTIGGSWKAVSASLGLPALRKIPAVLMWALLVAPPGIVLARRIRQLGDSSRVVMPYVLWVVASATYLPAIANDYNLIFLVVAGLMTWDRRDSWWVQASFVAAVMCLQPLKLPLPTLLVWSVKLLALSAVAASLARRMSEEAARQQTTTEILQTRESSAVQLAA